jgi:hypothetical protein
MKFKHNNNNKDETKSCVFENTNKVDNLLAKWIQEGKGTNCQY